MAKQANYRFRINTGWGADKDRSVVLSGAQAHYGPQFTCQCVNILYCVLKPLSLALRGKSLSEVVLAVTEAKNKLDSYFDLALTMVTVRQSNESGNLQFTPLDVDQSTQPNSKATVYSVQPDNLFEEDDD